MNLNLETKNKLDFLKNNLKDLEEIDEKDNLGKDCYIYIGRKVKSIKKDIRYFEKILSILENKI